MSSLTPPPLDDRDFEALMRAAVDLIQRRCPDWSDLSPGDPGVVLLEAFAVMTEALIQRLNRLPDNAYIEFLRLIGVQLQPPSAARVRLQFHLSRPLPHPLEIKRGSRVTSARGGTTSEPPLFTTARSVSFAPGTTEVSVDAYGCDWIEAELAGRGSGLPGQWVRAAQPPLIASSGDDLDLVVAVEADTADSRPASALQFDGKTFGIWREVENFSETAPNDFVYSVERVTGVIQFAPALRRIGADGRLQPEARAVAAVPPGGREIRLWYRRGGGAAANLPAHSLSVLKDGVAGVTVTNPEPALGGAAGETLENALLRGPQQLHSLRRAVTARDFELLAVKSSGAVSRARAFTREKLWRHARPGTVEIVLVPRLPLLPGQEAEMSLDFLQQHQSQQILEQVRAALDERRPLGVECEVNWANYKKAHIAARVIVTREEDPAEVKQRVLAALYSSLSPQTLGPGGGNRPFGQTLRSWDINKIIGTEPGVVTVDQLRLIPDSVPDSEVAALAADEFQSQTWFAGAAAGLFRSLNDGRGWEKLAALDGETVVSIKAYPAGPGDGSGNAGRVAVLTQPETDPASARLYLSSDCGESWIAGPKLQFRVSEMAWLRQKSPKLLLATEIGLYRVALDPGAVPEQILVDPGRQQLGFFAVASAVDGNGEGVVALAARGNGGVFLSMQSGEAGSFQPLKGMEKELVRVLAIQQRGPHSYLWAGIGAIGDESGKGCFRWRIGRGGDNPEGWLGFSQGWQASSCLGLAFDRSYVYAASRKLGVLRLELDREQPRWEGVDVNAGLPLRDVGRLHPVQQVALSGKTLMAAGPRGIYRSRDQGRSFEECSQREYSDEMTLPQTWLFCSGRHQIEVVSEDEYEQ